MNRDEEKEESEPISFDDAPASSIARQ